MTGFWGTPTSRFRAAEPYYSHSHYIAEWWNTVSNVFILVAGLLRNDSLGAVLIASAFASTAYHATAKEPLRWLDLSVVAVAGYVVSEVRAAALVVGGCALVVLAVDERKMTEFNLHPWWHLLVALAGYLA
jgi:hypothetical protein